MLKNIRLHIERDEEKQQALEAKLAAHIAANQKNSINAFQRTIPSLVDYISQGRSKNIAIFCNKGGNFNIVDYGLGRALYGFSPETEITQQFNDFSNRAHYIDFEQSISQTSVDHPPESISELEAYRRYQQYPSLSASANLVVVLGLGLGYHIKYLLQSSNIKHLIIYEPELQYFSCSILVTPWKEILDIAKRKGTALYFQLAKDGRDLVRDINELSQHYAVEGFYLYHHYHHPVFDVIQSKLSNSSWKDVTEQGITFNLNAKVDSYCPIWSPPIHYDGYSICDAQSPKFKANLSAFKKYFPAIYAEFNQYQPSIWLPIENEVGDVNILNKKNLVAWYSDSPKYDCLLNFQNYSEQPNKDGLVLGYKGEKLKNYIHYKFVKATEPLLDSLEEEEGALPDNIKSLIMFGLGVGYQLEHLFDSKTVEKLFICEPNRDFFYASLFAIDWSAILAKVDAADARIYINIGDDGTNLFRDLLNQFYAIGPYVLSHTYFYQSYYNSALTQAVTQLREQLQVVISMGEYFDHARYGIAHTTESLKCEYPYMVKKAKDKLSFSHKETPIFLVGNGPSIDQSIDSILEWKDRAIIVSCGTALQVLQRYGITPDFHAEIEQNRSTFDWAARINDFEFLKSITLISCNGIHPDTCELYKDVLLAFKDGESSTVSTLSVLGEDNFESLAFAFPTVTNFALNFFLKLGFRQLYLLGVDLGFVDSNKHHSSKSGYYKDNGRPMYDYQEKNNTSLIVPGNMRPSVFTKHEFKIAKLVMEQSLASEKVDCYNTSDGAKIIGTTALPCNNILLIASAKAKAECLATLRADCFFALTKEAFLAQYSGHFSQSTLEKELSMFKRGITQTIESSEHAEMLIESQKRMLFASYQQGNSLLFYMLYGTTNYANVLLNKVIYSFSESGFDADKFNQTRELWLDCFEKIESALTQEASSFDTSSSFPIGRIASCLQTKLSNVKVMFVSDNPLVSHYSDAVQDTLGYPIAVTSIDIEQFFKSYDQVAEKPDFIVFQLETALDDFIERITSEIAQHYSASTLIIVSHSSIAMSLISEKPANLHFYSSPIDYSLGNAPVAAGLFGTFLRVILYLLDFRQFDILVPKYILPESFNLDVLLESEDYDGANVYDLGQMLGLRFSSLLQQQKLENGVRAAFVGNRITPDMLQLKIISDDDYQKRKIKSLKNFPFLKTE